MSLVLKNAKIINVFTEEIIKGDILIDKGMIVGVGSYTASEVIDCRGKYICPAFIDAHVHMESSMVSPLEFSKTILRRGTTTIIADPHEMVNVAGVKAIEYLLEATENAPVNVYVMLPSSVPATIFETNGAEFTCADMKPFANHPRVLGLGEVMCYPDVLSNEKHILEKIALFKGKIIDGHAPNLSGQDLQRYIAAGINTDHECTTFAEAREKLRAGMKILIREGSGAKNLTALVQGIVESGLPCQNFMFCTDDKHLEEIEEQGHIDFNVRKAIALGLEPIQAIKIASYNAAVCYGLKNRGAIAPGHIADFLILDSLAEIKIAAVYKAGNLVTKEYLQSFLPVGNAEALRNTVSFQTVLPTQLALTVAEKNIVIEIIPEQILTKRLVEKIPSKQGVFVPSAEYAKLCVVERHRHTGNIAVAPIKGFGIRNGAIATTVAHDSHNLIAVGDNDEDLCLAINEVKKIGGGYVVVSAGVVVDTLPLELCGLMSEQGAEKVIEKIARLVDCVHCMGVPRSVDPFVTLSFMALPVIPEIRLTDKGLFNVSKFQLEE